MRVADVVSTAMTDIIEWPDDELGVMARKTRPLAVKYGAKLYVKDYQQAIFIVGGKFTDVFNPGLYTLTRETMPRTASLKRWDERFHDSFELEVFFLKTKYFIDVPWQIPHMPNGNQSVCGKFDIKVIHAGKLYNTITGSNKYLVGEVSQYIENVVDNLLPDALRESGVTTQTLFEKNIEIAEFIQESINIDLNTRGLLMRNLTIAIGARQ